MVVGVLCYVELFGYLVIRLVVVVVGFVVLMLGRVCVIVV